MTNPTTDPVAKVSAAEQSAAGGGTANGGSRANACKLVFGLPIEQGLQQLLNNEYLSDVVFKVGHPGELFHAHKNIITLASEVFFAQLNGHFAEAQVDQQAVPIRIVDIEPNAFMEVLRFIYCGHANIESENMLGIYYAAKKYMLKELELICRDAFHRLTNDDNVLKVFQDNLKHEFNYVDHICLLIICDNPLKFFKQDDFLNLDKKALLKIGAQNTINCHMDQLQEAIEKWKKKNWRIDVMMHLVRDPASEAQRSMCRKLHFFSAARFSENIDTSFHLTVKSPFALYGIGIFVGVENECWYWSLLAPVTITMKINDQQVFCKAVPILKDLYTYEIMFEKIVIYTDCTIQVRVIKPNNMQKAGIKMMHLTGFEFAGTLPESICQDSRYSTANSGRQQTCGVNCVSYLMCSY